MDYRYLNQIPIYNETCEAVYQLVTIEKYQNSGLLTLLKTMDKLGLKTYQPEAVKMLTYLIESLFGKTVISDITSIIDFNIISQLDTMFVCWVDFLAFFKTKLLENQSRVLILRVEQRNFRKTECDETD